MNAPFYSHPRHVARKAGGRHAGKALSMLTHLDRVQATDRRSLPKSSSVDGVLRPGIYRIVFDVAAYLPDGLYPEITISFKVTAGADALSYSALAEPFWLYNLIAEAKNICPISSSIPMGRPEFDSLTSMRSGPRHEVKELTVDVFLEGEFQAAFTKARQQHCVADRHDEEYRLCLARKNGVYSMEEFARDLARHFLVSVAHLNQVRLEIKEVPWARIGESPGGLCASGVWSAVRCRLW